ncbi:hypothetical protein HKX48_000365 [Thoreauomyces humboldtii]|nr:hypothetical protein HKX48_000365 [Thoreauomyces humboldtii]
MDAEWDNWLAETLTTDLGITDEVASRLFFVIQADPGANLLKTFAEYITQLCTEDSIEDEERQEVISEFLADASAQPVEPVVKAILARNVEARRRCRKREEEEKEDALKAAKQKELEALQSHTAKTSERAAGIPSGAGSSKKVLTGAEKLERERLLAAYGYEMEDDEEEENAEEPSEGANQGRGGNRRPGGGGGGGGDPLLARNDNAERVRAEEQAKKAKAAAEHQQTVARNKEMQEKQRLEKEKEKKKTVKKEKRRM